MSQPRRSVLILGGSRGIGAAAVRRFAADGDAVTFTYRSAGGQAERLAAETGARAVQADSGDRKALVAAVRAAGPLDVLVVSAGLSIMGAPVDLDPEEVDRLFEVNVLAPYHATVEASRSMRDGGRIILIGSILGERVTIGGVTAYAASKSALQGMARGFSRDFGDRRITVNVVEPGATDTDMNPADGPMKDLMHSGLSIKRHARPDEIAGFIAYLASEAAAMVTGSMHLIDGGGGA